MAHTLTRSSTVLTLPEHLLWTDEFAWRPVAQELRPSITGALIVDVMARQAGRPIELAGESNWITRADLLTLQSWASLPGEQFALVVRSEAARTVIFDHERGAIEAEPLVDYSTPASTDIYRLALRFIEV